MKKLYLTSAAILLAIPSAFATTDVEPVVVVKSDNGPVRISKADYDPKQHELHVADEHHDEHGVARARHAPIPTAKPSAPATATQPATPPAAAAATGEGLTDEAPATARLFGVSTMKNRFYVVDASNQKPVTDVEAFNVKGYATNKEAWDVITAEQAKMQEKTA